MANFKNGSIREMVIDKCLSDTKRRYSTKDLMDECNKILIQEGYHEVTSLNTIRNDLRAIEQRWYAYGGIIVEESEGRNKYYRYETPGFSIYKSELSQDDLNKLNQTLDILSRFKGLPQFEWMNELNARFKSSLLSTATTTSVISFDDNVDAEGKEYISMLFDAIVNKCTLKIKHKKFDNDTEKEHIVHPYYLKEYNNRWFLLCLHDAHKNLCTYALDRIQTIEYVHIPYIENKSLNFDEYFDDVIGVTVLPNMELRKIKLWVEKSQYPYIKTKPLHGSQKVLEHLPDGSKIVQIEVCENYELINLLLSYGEKVIVLEPIDLKYKVQDRLDTARERYACLKVQ